METKIVAIFPNPEPNDVAVAQSADGLYLVMELFQGSDASSINLDDVISFDWEPFGPGDAANLTQDTEINVIVLGSQLSVSGVKKHLPSFTVPI